MSTGTVLWLGFFATVAAWFIGRVLWGMYVVSSMRRVARESQPALDSLGRTITAFYEQHPVPVGLRLPMTPEDYPAARPRRPSPPRPRKPRRRSYRRRR